MAMTRVPLAQLKSQLKEREELRKLVNRCRTNLHERKVGPKHLRLQFHRLLEHLLNHFSQEEDHGYFLEIVDLATHSGETLVEHFRQHRQMVEMVVALMNSLECGELRGDAWLQLSCGFEEFFYLFEGHESAETELLQNAYAGELGEHD